MKMTPELENETVVENAPAPASISGDVIGDTAYSERFVLKILLKLANRDTLKHELTETSFEEELCMLWDMTVERDVVLYLLKHDALNLLAFAAPLITSDRIFEIAIGTVANMCCQKEAVDALIDNNGLLDLLFNLFSQEDSLVFIQLIRLISSCLYVADDDQLSTLMDKFSEYNYASTLYFILKNSLNKDLLMKTLENLYTICVKYEIKLSDKLIKNFVTADASQAVYLAHSEYSKLAGEDEDLERLHIITLQMLMILTKKVTINGEEKLICDDAAQALNLFRDIFVSYESRTAECCMLDAEFQNVLDLVKALMESLQVDKLCKLCEPDKYIFPCYNIWKALIPHKADQNELLKEYLDDIENSLSIIMCTYMAHCDNDSLVKVLDYVRDDYGKIVSQIGNAEMQAFIANRALNNKNSLKEAVHS